MVDQPISDNNFISLETAQDGTDFVGIKINGKERTITFPMGYKPPKDKLNTKKIEKKDRKEIFNLIKAITIGTNNKKGERISTLNGKEVNDFPIKSMLFIIEDFLDRNTYYTEKETLYTKNTSGKINWLRTIKNIKPAITETGISFLNFIVRKNRILENQLITELHKYCVYKCFELLGFLYTPILPEKGLLEEKDVIKDRKYYAHFLQDKIDNTHLEINIELFSNMLEFINNYDSETENPDASYGTSCFQVVWENLVEKMFSTIEQSTKEKYFYPSSRWYFTDGKKQTNHELRPDTIMLTADNKCFILDSKYYSYNMLHEMKIGEEDERSTILIHGSIPGTDSIQKQITYAQYLDKDIETFNTMKRKDYRYNHKDIYNVFILPEENNGEVLKYIGYANADWYDNKKNYHTIHAVTLDTKFLLLNAGKNGDEMRGKLAEIIISKRK